MNGFSTYWYQPVFLAELLIADMIFAHKLRKKRWFFLRIFCVLVFGLFLICLFPMDVRDRFNISVMFGLAFIGSLAGLRICFDESVWNILFCAIAAYAVRHIAFVLCSLLLSALPVWSILEKMGSIIDPYRFDGGVSALNPFVVLIYLDCYFLIYWYFGYFLNRRLRYNEDLSLGRKPLIIFSGLLIFVDIYLHMLTVSNIHADRLSVIVENIYNLICGILILFLQFGILSYQKLEKSKQQFRHMMEQNRKQYEISRDSMELINVKHHDLKHQIHMLRKRTDQEAVRELEEVVKQYDLIVKTGNKYMDSLLSDVCTVCREKHITFTYMIDGNCLEFMEAGDIYSLFGNATENAMEYVGEIDDKDKRFIHLTVKRTDRLTIVHMENYYDGEEWRVTDGLPRTTKQKKQNHGFGLRSMQMTAQKYGGALSVHACDHLFSLDIILPSEGVR